MTRSSPQQAEAFARSSRMRDLLESEMFERQLTDRLIDLATEGRGAVVNGWEPPASESAESEPATETTSRGRSGGNGGG